MHKSYHILSVEAADIYRAEQENGGAVGVQLPERNSDDCFRLFKVFLDNSLDSAALEKAYTRVCRKKFSFADEYGNAYTLAVVNVKFNYVYKPEGGKPVNLKALREHFYTNGFCVNGVHYVRYKRSAGSSREGKRLFIDERRFRTLNKWRERIQNGTCKNDRINAANAMGLNRWKHRGFLRQRDRHPLTRPDPPRPGVRLFAHIP